MCLFGWSHKGAVELRLKTGILTKHVKRAQGGIFNFFIFAGKTKRFDSFGDGPC